MLLQSCQPPSPSSRGAASGALSQPLSPPQPQPPPEPEFHIQHAVQGTFDDRMLSSLQGDAQAGNWEEQLKQMNMTPEDVIGKIMSEPTLATVGTRHLQTCHSSRS